MKKMASILLLVCIVLTLGVASTHAKEMTGSLSRQSYSITDNSKVYVTIAGTKDDARYQELTKLFGTDPGYAAIKEGSHYHTLSTDQTMYKARYSGDFSAFPTVRVQSTDGTVLKEWSGAGVPDSKTLLAEMQCLPRWRKPCQPKQPEPVKPEPTPEVKPEPAPRTYLPVWLVVSALVAGVGAAFINEMRRS